MTESYRAQAVANRVDFYIDRAELLMDSLRFEDARKQFALAIGESPDNAIAHCRMGVCLGILNAKQEAIEHGRTATSLAPQNPLVLQNFAWILFDSGHYREAKKVIHEAIRIEPEFSDAHTLLALILIRLSDNKSAIRSAEKALALDPNSSEAHRIRGIASQNLGDIRESEVHLRNAFRYDPENASTHLAMGCARFMQDDYEPAERYFRESLRIDPNFAPAQRMLLETQIVRTWVMRFHFGILEWIEAFSTISLKVLIVLMIAAVVLFSRGDSTFGMMLVPLGMISFAFLFTRVATEPLATLSVALSSPEARAMSRWNCLGSILVSFFFLAWFSLAIAGIAMKSITLIAIAVFLAYSYIPISVTWSCTDKMERIFMAGATVLIVGMGLFTLYYAAMGNQENDYNNSFGLWLLYCGVALSSLGLPQIRKKVLAAK